jgi:transposase-like protein
LARKRSAAAASRLAERRNSIVAPVESTARYRPSVSGLFKWRQFEPEVVLLAVGWYLRFSLSYRDVEELLAERGVHADHVTVWRWVQRYAPEMKRRLRPRLKPTNDSWRVDET